MKKYLLLLLLIPVHFLQAQTPTQTIRGVVNDKVSQSPLPGASVLIVGSNPVMGTVTDMNGNFKLSNVPVGKQTIKISMIGYKEQVLSNLVINAGKELVLTINIEEDISQLNEVVVTAKTEKNKTLNNMATVSGRTFSVEETQKYAAAVNDPARMATSFAGVVSIGDGGNNISIRGNSPNWLQWRMEGVEIPNPNHFSSIGASGGGISILNAQILTNSDFYTGAFTAEYGDALSGVFDLKLRKGNNEKREYTIQAGVLGIELAAEGPFKKGYEGSYLVNYRFSTLSILSKMGVSVGPGVTNFQDLSYNFSFPTRKLGTFTLFGFVGLSNQSTKAKKDSALWVEDEFNKMNSDFFSNTAMTGLTHTKLFKNQSYLKTVLSFSQIGNGQDIKELQPDYATVIAKHYDKYIQNKITLSSVYTKKFNPKSSMRAGFIATQMGYDFLLRTSTDSTPLAENVRTKGNTQKMQEFVNWNYRLSPGLSSNIGIHYVQFMLNNKYSVEPRASLKYEMNPKHALSLGYGLHSQLQNMALYFTKDAEGKTPNKNLEMSKAHHIVLGYDWSVNDHSRIKIETYYQHLFNIPISKDKSSTYSVINALWDFSTEHLVNNGLGRNYGIDFTYEQFMYKNLYYLFSASVFDSKYKAPNDKWYNTMFNSNYSTALTLGKEWTMSERRKSKVIGLNIKSLYVGGYRYTPIDLPASQAAGEMKLDDAKMFVKQNPDYWRIDIRISLKRNYAKATGTIALDLQNATNHKNVGGQYYDSKTGEAKYWYQMPIIPILSYRLEF